MDEIVFLFDVDNTLLDNDRVQEDLGAHLAACYGEAAKDRYWAIFEELRRELGYADYLGALERYRLEDLHDPRLLRMSSWLVDYPFAERLYPGAIDAVRRVAEWGPAVVLSDGDAVFQPRKVVQLYPAKHYVLIDDKLRILAAVKAIWGRRVTTVFPRQGHYANVPKALVGYPPADIQVERIGELVAFDRAAFMPNKDPGVRT